MFIIKKEKLQPIENAFSIIKNGDYKNGENELSKNLSDIFKKKISVNIIPVSKSKQFFAMCVIPEESTMNKIASSIMNNKTTLQTVTSLWKKCNTWKVEIDANILTPSFTDRELAGLLMHEVGHIIDTNSVPVRINTIIQYTMAKANAKASSSLSHKTYQALVKIPIVHACTCGDTETIKKELKADKFAANCGYLTDLMSAMTKIERICSTRLATDKSIESATNFSINVVNQLRERKAELARTNMGVLKEKLSNNYMKECVDDFIYNVLTQKDEVIYENADLIEKKEYYTEFLGIGKKKLDPITQTQLDYIQAKIDGMESIDDKIMLLSYTNSKLELCDYYLDLLHNPKLAKKYIIPNSEQQLVRFKARLNQLREFILKYKIQDRDRFVVFYPNKYEG